MRLLVLTRYGRLGASSRMRFLQYLPSLRAAGLQATVSPLFSDAYVEGLQYGRRKPGEVLRAYASRTLRLLEQGNHDLLWIEKECLPWLPSWVEQALLGRCKPFVLDYDDAVFHQYDQHRLTMVRAVLGLKHQQLIRGAALVVAGNDYIADYARAVGAHRVEILPTVLDMVRYTPRSALAAPPEGPGHVGWVGQRATAAFLQPLAPVFQSLLLEGTARFTAIGIDAAALELPMDSLPWSEATEAEDIARFDIGIMPLVDAPFERGKCGYKLIQYMASGLPVVASPVGVNRQIVEHGVNGFLAETLEDWKIDLRTLCANPALRARMGAAGRRKVEQHYSLQATAPRLSRILIDAAARNRDP
jgi:glycosyltransferase involved in cell wall biosynthesis